MQMPDTAAAYLAMKSVLLPTPPPSPRVDQKCQEVVFQRQLSTNQRKAEEGHRRRRDTSPDFPSLPGRLSPKMVRFSLRNPVSKYTMLGFSGLPMPYVPTRSDFLARKRCILLLGSLRLIPGTGEIGAPGAWHSV